ncbi:hypothetical protein QP178_17440 [Sphingomonas aurantiaca]|uniref:hypothetical protein n=1 Tax=Sphingomonas aurantiaca TaxID=185949 RepID=UPI002FDFFE1D
MPHDILTGLAMTVFGSAGATAIGVMRASIAPQWSRICRLALGNVEPEFKPLSAMPFAKTVRS